MIIPHIVLQHGFFLLMPSMPFWACFGLGTPHFVGLVA
jgi:hypothetical protein